LPYTPAQLATITAVRALLARSSDDEHLDTGDALAALGAIADAFPTPSAVVIDPEEGSVLCPHCPNGGHVIGTDDVPHDWAIRDVDASTSTLYLREIGACPEGSSETRLSCSTCDRTLSLPQGWSLDYT
jgi:hypothetical protein